MELKQKNIQINICGSLHDIQKVRTKKMNKEDTKQAILGFTEFFKGITGNQDLKIPDDIAKEYAIEPNKWIPVKWHEITDEEREREGYPKDWVCHLDSIMPYDGQRILITTKGGFVELDECYSDDGCTFSLDSGYDWIDDVVAWMPLPEPYKEG